MGRILLIEDEQGAMLLFQSRLEEMGHEVVGAPTGAHGLMEARAGRFDLFLVDVVLGSGIDGYEVCRRLRAIPQLHGIPVVLISGQLKNRMDLHRGYEAGCSSFLIKGDLPLLEDVVRAMLSIKSLQDDLGLQNRLLEEQNRRLQEERLRGADLEVALRESGDRSLVFRELAAGRPDGILMVDADGVVRFADRGAIDILGKDLEGKTLGSLAPASGLEAFVRDVQTEVREGFRFDHSTHCGARTRSLSASVLPIVPLCRGGETGLRAVLLLDAGKRKVAAEMLRLQEQGIPRRELGPMLEAARSAFHPSAIRGVSPAMVELRRRVAKLASSETPVLIRGESGTGKDLLARALHYGGWRSGAYVPVGCADLASALLESELCGHLKGAFDGAISDRPGLFQQAHNGTIFLDEVDALPSELQAMLLRVLRTCEVVRVGSRQTEQVCVRVVAACSHDLEDAVLEGRFRADLAQALGAVELRLPPLRDRPGDVEILVRHFIRRYGVGRDELELTDEAWGAFQCHDWPGNVRELENSIERACSLVEGSRIGLEHLPQPLRDLGERPPQGHELPPARPRVGVRGTHAVAEQGPSARTSSPLSVEDREPISLSVYEKRCLLRALEQTRGDKLAAARLLDVGKSTFYRKLKAHGIT